MPALFQYHPDIVAAFPSVRAGVIHATGLANGPSPRALAEEFWAQQQSSIQSLRETNISELQSISAWRRAFTEFGVKPTQYRSAAEALLRRLAKQGDVPSISLLVDIGNLVSVRHALPVALFDQAAVSGATTVRFATGTETFTDLGASETIHPVAGEVVFVDDDGVVSARRWCWRQSAQSATSSGTKRVLITVEGHHEQAENDVRAALSDILSLLARYQPEARLEYDELSPEKPGFAVEA